MDIRAQEPKRSGASVVVSWLVCGLLAGAVVFGLYVWAKPAKNIAADRMQAGQAAPTTPGVRLPMPRGDIPGWHEVFADDFSSGALDPAKWTVYSGQPGTDRAAWFDPAHVKESQGMLVISGYQDPADGGKWATGGLSTRPGMTQTYGKYLVRFRLDTGAGIGHTLQLFAADGSWPPEIDFSEDNGCCRNQTLATLHYGPDDSKIHRLLSVWLTQWHTLGVEWTRNELRFTLDGRVWSTIDSNAVPSIPMALAMQTQTWPCVGTWGRCPDASTPPVVRMYVDWVVAYAPAARR